MSETLLCLQQADAECDKWRTDCKVRERVRCMQGGMGAWNRQRYDEVFLEEVTFELKDSTEVGEGQRRVILGTQVQLYRVFLTHERSHRVPSFLTKTKTAIYVTFCQRNPLGIRHPRVT